MSHEATTEPRTGQAALADLTSYWNRELENYRAFTADRGSLSNYRDWQPAKWQSLAGVVTRTLAATAATDGTTVRSALELGCGSATLLIQLALTGVTGVGVDRLDAALRFGEEAARSLGADNRVAFVKGDFFDRDFIGHLAPADLVLSSGVIEHWDREGQLRVLDKHCRLSARWVLVGIPNLKSPVFKSFARWAEHAGRSYDDHHYDISVPWLVDRLGVSLVAVDGCHVFHGKAAYHTPGDTNLDQLYDRLRGDLIAIGGERYRQFPWIDFESEDIPALYTAEMSLSRDERVRFGFMTFYLIDTRP